MNEQQTREMLADYTREQLIEMVIDMLDHEREMREQIDSLTGTIR
jgi:hypothetical protein